LINVCEKYNMAALVLSGDERILKELKPEDN